MAWKNEDKNAGGAASGEQRRTCGVKPGCPDERAARVAEAVRQLERIGAPFSVADVADRSGVSRATIYRSAELRDLIGAKGDGHRSVHADRHAKLAEQHEDLKRKARELRRRVKDAEQGWEEMRARALRAEEQLREAERRAEAFARHRPAAADLRSSLHQAASRLDAAQIRQARRLLARALHPDLFEKDPAAAALATEILKSLNELAG